MSSSFIDNYIKKNKEQFAKYKSYIENNVWNNMDVESILKDEYFNDLYSNDKNKVKQAEVKKLMFDLIKKQKETVKAKTDEYKLQYDLVQFVLSRLKTFTTKSVSEKHTKKYKDFIKYCMSIVEIHINRVEEYLYSIDITKIENQDVRSEEIKLTKECHDGLTKIDEKVTAMNLNDEEVLPTIEFLNDKKAPLSMHSVLINIPEYATTIKKALEEKQIDLESPPKNEMLIYATDVPKWDDNVHYWENSKEALQFYFDEFKKLNNGIVIDGYYVSGWMYYHINVFVTPIPHKVFNKNSKQYESKDIITNPPLRDSDVFVFDSHEEAKIKKTLFTFIAATRRAAKTTLESSKLGHASTIGKKELLCAGGSAKDLNQIAKNFRTDIQYKNPAFAVYNVANDWKDKVEMGLKTKSAKTILLSTLYIVNTDGGNSAEILAGFTPDEFVFDEIMKGKFIEALEGLKPALKGTDGLIRCFGTLSGTGGSEELSKDGRDVLKDPIGNDVLPMNWELLERGIPEEHITWKEDKKSPFGTFIPGQMCVDMPKIESSLAEYLGKKDAHNLQKIKLKVTDWGKAKEQIKEKREKKKGNRIAYNKEVVYIPIKPSEIFLSGKLSPFPYEEASKHLQKIRESGDIGKKADIMRNDGKIVYSLSEKTLPEFPHGGGFHDSPVILFEELPKEKPPRGLYVAALDDYKQEQANSDSLGCFIIYKRQAGNDEWGDRIVAIYTSRPDPHSKFHRWGHMLLEAFNAECLMENEDMEFKVFLDNIRETERWLVPSFNIAGDITLKNNNRRMYGISPNGNKSAIINKVVNYCKNQVVTVNEEGNEIFKLGVELINDEMLLEEIINYKEGENHDRITTFGIALIQAHYLDANYIEARLAEPKREEVKKEPFKRKLFTETRRRVI